MLLFSKKKIITTVKIISIFLLIGFFFSFTNNGFIQKSTSNNNSLNSLYSTWKTIVNNNMNYKISSDLRAIMQIEEFQQIQKTGLSAIPFILDKMEKEQDNIYGTCLFYALSHITKKRIDPRQRFIVKWWNENRILSREEFEIYYQKWLKDSAEQKFKRPFSVDFKRDFDDYQKWENMSDGPEKEKQRPFQRTQYQRMLDLGIPALPYAIEKIHEGDEDLIEAVNYWTDDALKNSAEIAGVPREQMRQYCLQWWEQNKDDWLLPPVEEAPEP